MVILPYNDRDHLRFTAQSLAVELNLPLRVQAGCASNGHSSQNCLWSHFLRPKTHSSRGRAGSLAVIQLCHFMLNSLTIELDKKFPSPLCRRFLARRWRGIRRTWQREKHTFQMHDCTPNLAACHSVLGSGGEVICLWHAHTHTYTYDRLASETYTHAQSTSHVLPGEGGRVCYNELVPSRLSARVSQWRCLRESNVCHANRCGLSARTNTDARSSTLSHAWRVAPGTWLDSTHTLFHLPMSIPLTLKSTKKHKHTHMHNYTHIRCSNEGSY